MAQRFQFYEVVILKPTKPEMAGVDGARAAVLGMAEAMVIGPMPCISLAKMNAGVSMKTICGPLASSWVARIFTTAPASACALIPQQAKAVWWNEGLLVSSFELIFGDDFEDVAWLLESRGWYGGAVLACNGSRYELCFYDPVRLLQEIEDELSTAPVFIEPNLVVVPKVTRAHMERAAARLVATKSFEGFSKLL